MMLTVTRGLSNARPRPYPVVTIGNFDGHHLGHRTLLQTVVDAARKNSGTPMVLTFDPHPVKILAPQVDLRFLTSPEEKLVRFAASGIQEVVFLEFTPTLANMTPEQFVDAVLHRQLRVAEVFVGKHFAFGKGRTGTIDDLSRLGSTRGFEVHPVSPVMLNGDVVSSTKIRRLIQAGHMEQAAVLLGRTYSLEGKVVPGRQLGQAIGYPTANLRIPPHRVIPPDGVYVARASQGQQTNDAIAYIGTRPTFGAGERLIEVNFLDQRRDLYGQDITVEFVERLRGDQAFESADALAEQIARDAECARARLRHSSQGVK